MALSFVLFSCNGKFQTQTTSHKSGMICSLQKSPLPKYIYILPRHLKFPQMFLSQVKIITGLAKQTCLIYFVRLIVTDEKFHRQ